MLTLVTHFLSVLSSWFSLCMCAPAHALFSIYCYFSILLFKGHTLEQCSSKIARYHTLEVGRCVNALQILLEGENSNFGMVCCMTFQWIFKENPIIENSNSCPRYDP